MVSARKRIWGWYFFDWASQPYNTLLLTFIFGPYFAEVARGYYMGLGLEAEAAKAAGQTGYGAQWSGMGAARARAMPVDRLMAALADELGAARSAP